MDIPDAYEYIYNRKKKGTHTRNNLDANFNICSMYRQIRICPSNTTKQTHTLTINTLTLPHSRLLAIPAAQHNL